MSLKKYSKRPIATKPWYCDCRHSGPILLSRKNCPHCGAAMPQHVRDAVYKEVRAELVGESRREWGERLSKFGALCLRFWPLTFVALVILGIGVFRLVAPDAYDGITGQVGGALQGFGNTAGNVLSGIGGFLKWLLNALGFVVMILLRVLQWLWGILKLVFGWIWTLLGLLYENMPEICGWLWRALQWLWNGALYLLGQLWRLLQLLWINLPDILSGLWQVIRAIVGWLGELLVFFWELIYGLFNLIF